MASAGIRSVAPAKLLKDTPRRVQGITGSLDDIRLGRSPQHLGRENPCTHSC